MQKCMFNDKHLELLVSTKVWKYTHAYKAIVCVVGRSMKPTASLH